VGGRSCRGGVGGANQQGAKEQSVAGGSGKDQRARQGPARGAGSSATPILEKEIQRAKDKTLGMYKSVDKFRHS
jgi:hypothetical protein